MLLPSQGQEQHPLPWFGAIQGLVLVHPEHSLDGRSEPAALIALNEGGQLIVHDMHTLKPLPLFLPLQELPPVTASAFVAHEASAAPQVQPIALMRHHLPTMYLTARLPKVNRRRRVAESSGADAALVLLACMQTTCWMCIPEQTRVQCMQDGEGSPHAFSAADLRAVHAASAESPEHAAAHRSRWMLNRGTLPTLDAMSEVRAGPLPDKSEGVSVLQHWKGRSRSSEPVRASHIRG